jgi:hypothetical protein
MKRHHVQHRQNYLVLEFLLHLNRQEKEQFYYHHHQNRQHFLHKAQWLKLNHHRHL